MNDKLIGAIDKVLGLNSTALIALGAFVGSVLYAGWQLGSLYDDVRSVVAEQQHSRLCERIGSCPLCDKLKELARDAQSANKETREHVDSHNREFAEWKRRIIVLEAKVYGISPMSGMQP